MTPLSPAALAVRRHDPDRFLAALFAPAGRREALMLLYAFNHEIARAREVASEPTLALIRLQWWREVVEGAPRRHPLAEPLAEALDQGGLAREDLLAMLDGRELETEADMPSVEDFQDYVRATAGAIAVASGRALGAAPAMFDRLRAVGVAYGVAGQLRSVAALAAQGRCLLPADLLAAHGLTPELGDRQPAQPGAAAGAGAAGGVGAVAASPGAGADAPAADRRGPSGGARASRFRPDRPAGAAEGSGRPAGGDLGGGARPRLIARDAAAEPNGRCGVVGRMVRGIIFDIDGTLVNSVDLHARAWEEAFAEFGHALDFAAIRSQIGKGGDQLIPVFLSEPDRADHGRALEQRSSAIFKQSYLSQVRAFPGVRPLFQELRRRGVSVALASSAKQDELAEYKRIAGITDLVQAAASSDDAEKSKPHPDIFQAALARLPEPARTDALVVGDTPYDAEAAAKAGLACIGVRCGGFPELDLRRAGCRAIYQDPADLLRSLDRVLDAAAA